MLDTNIFLDCWVFNDPHAAALTAAIDGGRIRLLREARIDAEIEAVLARPQFKLSAEQQAQLLARWCRTALPLPTPPTATLRCADASDQKFLDLALAAGAAVLVTKDRALLKLARAARAHRLAIVDLAGRRALSGGSYQDMPRR